MLKKNTHKIYIYIYQVKALQVTYIHCQQQELSSSHTDETGYMLEKQNQYLLKIHVLSTSKRTL